MFSLTFSHKIPSGLRKNVRLLFYKHKFPSGIIRQFDLRKKAESPVKLLVINETTSKIISKI
jgi:hypothetical protein